MRKTISTGLFIFFISCMPKVNKLDTASSNDNSITRIQIFANDTSKSTLQYEGFGYDIYLKGRRYIHQPGVPAIPENKGFATQAAAQKTAELVAYKIQHNILPPSISLQELDSLGVIVKSK
ncbi:MAG: DUF4907 domain-containing protein [Ginsengibacter sp.]